MNEDLLKISHDVKQGALQNAKGLFDKKNQDEITEKSLNIPQVNTVEMEDGKNKERVSNEILEKIAHDYNEIISSIARNAKEELFDINLPFYSLNPDNYLEQLPESFSPEEIQKIKDEVDNANAEIRMRAEILKTQAESEKEKTVIEDEEEIVNSPKELEVEVKPVEKDTEPILVAETVPMAESEVEPKMEKNETEKEKTPEISNAEKELLDEIKIARDEYADVQYRELKMKNVLRKALGLKDNSTNEDTENIKIMRERYENALRKYKDHKFTELTDGGKDEAGFKKEAKELITFFNYEEAIKFYDARSEARMSDMIQKNTEEKNLIKKSLYSFQITSEKVANFYNKKVPTYAKLALAGITFLPGLHAIKAGKRGWGAFMMCAAGGMQIDKLAQLKDRFSNSAEINELFKNLSYENEKEDSFDKLNSVLDAKILTLDNKLKHHIARSQINKGIAFVSALALGASTFEYATKIANGTLEARSGAGIFGKLLGKIWEHKDEGHVGADVHDTTSSSGADLYKRLGGANLKDPETGKIINNYNQHSLDKNLNVGVDQTESVKAGLSADKAGTVEFGKLEGGLPAADQSVVAETDKFGHITPSGAMNEAEQAAHVKEVAAAEVAVGERIPIEKGNGIRDTLFKYLKQHHPEIKDKEYVVTQMVRDFRHDNPGKNLDLVFKNNSLVINDHNGFHITGIEGNDNWGNGQIEHHANTTHHAATHSSKVLGSVVESKVEAPSDVPTDETYKEWNKDVLEAANKVNEDKYNIASAISRGAVPALDPTDPNFSENLGYSKTLTEAAHSKLYNWGPSWEVGRLGDVIKESKQHMQSLLDMPDKETFTKIGKDFFDNKKSNILKFGNMKVTDALQDPSKMEGLSEKARKLIVGYANQDMTKPKPNETFKLWSYRIMTLTRRAAESKVANSDFDPSGL